MLTALDHLQEVQEEQTSILHHLEARPIVDLAGIERRLDEVADAVERRSRPEPQRHRAWWRTPCWVTLAFMVGVGSGWGSVRWAVQHVPGMALTQPMHVPTQPPARKGR